MNRLLSSTVFTLTVLMGGALSATEGDLQLEIPRPNLSGLQPAARQKIETLQEALEKTVAVGESEAPELREGFGFLGQMFHAFELFDAAEVCYGNAAALSPQDPRWAYYLGLVNNSQGDLEEAIRFYGLAVELGLDPVAPSIRLGDALLELGRGAEAGAHYQRVLELQPDSAAALFGLGRVAALGGDSEQAIEMFEKALTLQPEASAIHYPLAQAYRAAGDTDAATRHLALRGDRRVGFPDPLASTVTSIGKSTALEVVADLALQDEGFSEESFLGFVLSQFAHVPGSEEQLIKTLDHLESSPDSTDLQRARVAYAIGGLLVQRGRDEEALEYFERTIAGDPELRDAYVKIGNILARSERFEEALARYDRALELDADDPEVLVKKATALVNLEQLDAASATVGRALTLDSQRASTWLLQAEIQAIRGQSEAVTESFTQALEVARDAQETTRVHVAQGNFLRQEQRFEEAAREYLKALRIDEGYIPALDQLATLLGGLGYYEQAAEVYRKWTEEDPEAAGAWLSEATFLILAERFELARERLEAALAILPENLDLKDVLARHLAACPDPSVRDGKRAVELARELYQEVPTTESIETLAMALAQDGQFEEAIAWQNQLIRDADLETQALELNRWRANLALYELGSPCCAKPSG